MPTLFEKNIDQNKKSWFVFDAKGQTLGRMATQIADVIRGKHKVTFTPHNDAGDFAIVINASEIKITGNKAEGKLYYDHSGFVSGLKIRKAKDVSNAEQIERAVWGMIGKGVLGRQQIGKLKIYDGAEHPHKAQNPKAYVVRKNKKTTAKK
jgi:large subunit ribosomal protein L13